MWIQSIDVDKIVAGDKCEISKKTHNDARLVWLAFTILTIMLATACVLAAIYSFIAFDDDLQARGWIALIGAVAGLGGTIGLGTLADAARKQERYMWTRVTRECN